MNEPTTAPKDGTIFLAHFGYPHLVTTIWNPVSCKWAVAVLQTEPVDGDWNDHYFETGFEHEQEMRYWRAMPKLQTL